MTVQEKCALAGGNPTRGAATKGSGRGNLSTSIIGATGHAVKPHLLTAILAQLDDLRAAFWAASDRGDPQLDDLARAYRATYRKARQFSRGASQLLDQALEQEARGLEMVRRARAIRASLERSFIPTTGNLNDPHEPSPRTAGEYWATVERDLEAIRAHDQAAHARAAHLDALGHAEKRRP